VQGVLETSGGMGVYPLGGAVVVVLATGAGAGLHSAAIASGVVALSCVHTGMTMPANAIAFVSKYAFRPLGNKVLTYH
jgi:hypothetical protein